MHKNQNPCDFAEQYVAHSDKEHSRASIATNAPQIDAKLTVDIDSPRSPARLKAAKYDTAAKVSGVVSALCYVLSFIGYISNLDNSGFEFLIWAIVPGTIAMALVMIFEKGARKLRCIKYTTGICIDTTVVPRSGLHPIVEYEVNGVTYKTIMDCTCTHNAVGKTFAVYYDPYNPGSNVNYNLPFMSSLRRNKRFDE